MPNEKLKSIFLNKNIILLILFWSSVLFSPLLNIGAYLRVDHIVFLLLAFLLLIKKRFKLKVPHTALVFILFAVSLAFFAIISANVGLLSKGSANFYFALNWPLKIIWNVIIGLCIYNIITIKYKQHEIINKTCHILLICIFFYGVLAILQVAEFHGYIPTIGINSFLSKFYPYRGNLPPEYLVITKGYLLKMGGMGRATITEGQPILAGNILAFLLIMLLPLLDRTSRVFIYMVGLLGLILTLTRGAIIAWICGIVIFLLFLFYDAIKRHKMYWIKRYLVIWIIIGMCCLIFINITPFGEVLHHRLDTSFSTMKGSGVIEPRFERVWPEALDAVNSADIVGWLFGVPGGYKGATDSQYLWLLVNVGLTGLILFIILHCYIAWVGWSIYVSMLKVNRSYAFFGLGLTSAICTLLVAYIVNPALQSDRLLTILVVSSIIIDNSKRKSVNNKVNVK